MVFFYSFFYMSGTQDFRRFVYLLVVFIMSMFFLVFSGNFFTIMVGWDGLGFVSFCLVVFYSSSSSLCSGLLTVFINRVGDSFFLVCFYFFWVGGFFSTCLVLDTGVAAGVYLMVRFNFIFFLCRSLCDFNFSRYHAFGWDFRLDGGGLQEGRCHVHPQSVGIYGFYYLLGLVEVVIFAHEVALFF